MTYMKRERAIVRMGELMKLANDLYKEKCKKMKIDNSKCVKCGACVMVCEKDIIHFAKLGLDYDPKTDEDMKKLKSMPEFPVRFNTWDCTGCGECKEVCPAGAIE